MKYSCANIQLVDEAAREEQIVHMNILQKRIVQVVNRYKSYNFETL